MAASSEPGSEQSELKSKNSSEGVHPISELHVDKS